LLLPFSTQCYLVPIWRFGEVVIDSSRRKVALVTGSTGGIGREIARALASEGYKLIVHGIDGPDIGEQICKDMLAAGADDVAYLGWDLLLEGSARDLIAKAVEQFGIVDVLINNAGIQYVAPISDLPDDKWKQILELNLSAPFFLTKNVLPIMRQSGWGRIINISSVHGIVASVDKSAYVSAKHGLIGLTKSVALETAGDAITCNAICPGYVQTSLAEAQLAEFAASENIPIDKAVQPFLAKKQPSGEFVKPSDVGAMAVFLCSNACAQITGSSFTMDGGWTAQ
jgi:3-hydroxybutyrate dehydrogenase